MDEAISDFTGLLIWLVMSSAFWGFFGVIVGAIATMSTSFVQSKLERERHKSVLLQTNLNSLQDALWDMRRGAARIAVDPQNTSLQTIWLQEIHRAGDWVNRVGDEALFRDFSTFTSLAGPDSPAPDEHYAEWVTLMTDSELTRASQRINLRIAQLIHRPELFQPLSNESLGIQPKAPK